MNIIDIINNDEGVKKFQIEINNYFNKFEKSKNSNAFKNVMNVKSPIHLLQGKWGIGKTYFIDKYMSLLEDDQFAYIDVLDESFSNLPAYSIVEKIFRLKKIQVSSDGIFSRFSKAMLRVASEKLSVVKVISDTIQKDENTFDKLESVIDLIEELNLELGKNENSKKIHTIIIDNFERLPYSEQETMIKFVSILSKISFINVIIISNLSEECFGEKRSEQLSKYLDKFITGIKFELLPSFESILNDELCEKTPIIKMLESGKFLTSDNIVVSPRTIAKNINLSNESEFILWLDELYGHEKSERKTNNITNAFTSLFTDEEIKFANCWRIEFCNEIGFGEKEFALISPKTFIFKLEKKIKDDMLHGASRIINFENFESIFESLEFKLNCIDNIKISNRRTTRKASNFIEWIELIIQLTFN